MEDYIKQLIEDMRLAAENAPQPDYSGNSEMDDDEAFPGQMEQVERYLHGPTEKLSDILGVPLSMLPDDEKLSNHQLEALVQEMENLLKAWRFYPEYPGEAPARMKYQALRQAWEDEFVLKEDGMTHIEFCDNTGENCQFPGYCKTCGEANKEEFEDMPENSFPKEGDRPIGNDGPKRTNTDEDGFISGVHNYCDRWCERCHFTKVCRSFAMEKEFMEMIKEKRADSATDGSKKDIEVSGEDLVPDFDEDNIDEEPVDDSVFDMDFDIDPDDYEDPRKDFFSPQNKAERHPLTVLVDKFMDDSHDWIEEQYKLVEDNFTRFVAIGDPDDLMEAFEIILRYHYFVPVKLRRALHGYFEQHDDDFESYDMNGTAKVMLISIDDSIASLKVLKRFFKDKKDIIDKLTVQLFEILTEAEKLFPDARAFIRPGLDE